MKVALYKMMSVNVTMPHEADEWIECNSDYIRLSEIVEVEFPQLSTKDTIDQQLEYLNSKEQELTAKYQKELTHIEGRRQELLALPGVEE